MHPRSGVLLAYSDAEGDTGLQRRIAQHVQKCEQCRNELQRIRNEKESFSSFDTIDGTAEDRLAGMDIERGLAAVLSAIAAWKDGPIGGVEARVRSRVREQIEFYFGNETAGLMDRPGIRAGELLASTLELAGAFLGRNAADALREDVLRGLDCAGLHTETSP